MLTLPFTGDPDEGIDKLALVAVEATGELHEAWGLDPMLILESLELVEGINCLGRFFD